MQAGERGPIKIGWVRECSLSAAEARRQALQTGCPQELRVLAAVPGGEDVERILHDCLAEYRTVGEWFYLEDKLDGRAMSPDVLYEWCGVAVSLWMDETYGAKDAA